MNDTSLEIPRNWSFETQSIAHNFDRHVREQLPWYDMATNAVSVIARHYIGERGLVYDIGASTGNIGRALRSILKDRKAHLVALEPSADMCKLYDAPGDVQCARAEVWDYKPFDFAVLFLSLMFVPMSERWSLLNKLRERCKPGGAIVVFDKQPPAAGYAATVMWRLTLAGKVAAGVEPKEIVQKELSLAGVQRPTPRFMYGDAVQWFQYGDFIGMLIDG